MRETDRNGIGGKAEALVSAGAVEEQLNRILRSGLFINSRRLSEFLRYAVSATLKGRKEQIKEYLIGVDVFGRNRSYDPRTDPVVRVEAGRLRTKLTEYYQTEGQTDDVIIELPKGGYVPIFYPRTSALKSPGANPRPTNKLWSYARAVFLTAIAIAAVLLISTHFHRQKLSNGPPSIVVLPFLNLSENPGNDYLSEGVTEELTTELAEVRGLRVVARTSAFQFRAKGEDVRRIGERLNVGAILEGSVTKSGKDLHLTAQLISTHDGYHLWSATYDGENGELYAIEDQIVRQALRALAISSNEPRRVSEKPRTENPEAHDLYLEGRYAWSKRDFADMERSIVLFQAAISKDPNFALAYTGLAETYVVLAGNGQKSYSEVMPLARAALDRALELDPKLSQAHIVYAMLISPWGANKFEEFRRAAEMSPGYATAHHWYGVVLSAAGRFEEADAELRTAQTLDPLSPMITEGLAENFYFWRRYDQAIEQVHRLHEMGSSLADPVLGLVLIQKGMYADAIELFRKLPDGDESGKKLAYLSCAYAASGRREQALTLLREASTKGYVPPFLVARIYVMLGDKDAAFLWLEKAYEEPDPTMALGVDPIMDSIRADQRYLDLLRKTGS